MTGWVTVVVGRKLLIAVILVFENDAFLQSYYVLYVMLIAMVLQLQYKPFNNPLLNRLESLCIMTIILTQSLTLAHHYFVTEDVEDAEQCDADDLGGGTGGASIGYMDGIMIFVNVDTLIFIAINAWRSNKAGYYAFKKQAKAVLPCYPGSSLQKLKLNLANYEFRERMYYMKFSKERREALREKQDEIASLYNTQSLGVLDAVREVAERTAKLANTLSALSKLESFPLPDKWDMNRGMQVTVNKDGKGTWYPATIERVGGRYERVHAFSDADTMFDAYDDDDEKDFKKDGTYDVVYDDCRLVGNTDESVIAPYPADPDQDLVGRPVHSRVPRANLRIIERGDMVEVRKFDPFAQEWSEWTPAVIVNFKIRGADDYGQNGSLRHEIRYQDAEKRDYDFPTTFESHDVKLRDLPGNNYADKNRPLRRGDLVDVRVYRDVWRPTRRERTPTPSWTKAVVTGVHGDGASASFDVMYEDEHEIEDLWNFAPSDVKQTKKYRRSSDTLKQMLQKNVRVEVLHEEAKEWYSGFVARVNTQADYKGREIPDDTFEIIYDNDCVWGSQNKAYSREKDAAGAFLALNPGQPVDKGVKMELIRPAAATQGTPVEIDYTGDGVRLVPATICGCNGDGTYAVTYDEGVPPRAAKAYALYEKALKHERRQHIPSAVRDLKAAKELLPNSTKVAARIKRLETISKGLGGEERGRELLGKGQFWDAIKAFRKTIALIPALKVEHGDTCESIQLPRKKSKGIPTAEATNEQGITLLHEGNFTEALDAFRDALRGAKKMAAKLDRQLNVEEDVEKKHKLSKHLITTTRAVATVHQNIGIAFRLRGQVGTQNKDPKVGDLVDVVQGPHDRQRGTIETIHPKAGLKKPTVDVRLDEGGRTLAFVAMSKVCNVSDIDEAINQHADLIEFCRNEKLNKMEASANIHRGIAFQWKAQSVDAENPDADAIKMAGVLRAIGCFEKASKLEPDNALAFSYLGVAYQLNPATRNTKEAATSFGNAIQHAPNIDVAAVLQTMDGVDALTLTCPEKVPVPPNVGPGETFSHNIGDTDMLIKCPSTDPPTTHIYVDKSVKSDDVRVVVSNKFKGVIKQWMRSEQVMFKDLEEVETQIVNDTIQRQKAAAEDIMVKCATSADVVLENVHKATNRQLEAVGYRMQYDAADVGQSMAFSAVESQLYHMKIEPHLEKVLTMIEKSGTLVDPNVSREKVVEVESDVEEYEENLDMAEDDVMTVADLIDATKGSVVWKERFTLLQRAQDKLEERDAAVNGRGGLLRSLRLCSRKSASGATTASVELPQALKKREKLNSELSQAKDASDHYKVEGLESQIRPLDEKLKLYDAREQRRKLIKKLLAQSLVKQEQHELQQRIETYNEQLMDYDVLERQLIRKHRLKKWKKELDKLLSDERRDSNGKDPGDLVQWKAKFEALLKHDDGTIADSKAERTKVHDEMYSVKKKQRELDKRETDFLNPFGDDDDGDDPIKLAKRLRALQEKHDLLDERLEEYDRLNHKIELKTKIDNDTWRVDFLSTKREQQAGRRENLHADTHIPFPGFETYALLWGKHKKVDNNVKIARLRKKAKRKREQQIKTGTKKQAAGGGGASDETNKALMRVASMAHLGLGKRQQKKHKNVALWNVLRLQTDSMRQASRSRKIMSQLRSNAEDLVRKDGGKVKAHKSQLARRASSMSSGAASRRGRRQSEGTFDEDELDALDDARDSDATYETMAGSARSSEKPSTTKAAVKKAAPGPASYGRNSGRVADIEEGRFVDDDDEDYFDLDKEETRVGSARKRKGSARETTRFDIEPSTPKASDESGGGRSRSRRKLSSKSSSRRLTKIKSHASMASLGGGDGNDADDGRPRANSGRKRKKSVEIKRNSLARAGSLKRGFSTASLKRGLSFRGGGGGFDGGDPDGGGDRRRDSDLAAAGAAPARSSLKRARSRQQLVKALSQKHLQLNRKASKAVMNDQALLGRTASKPAMLERTSSAKWRESTRRGASYEAVVAAAAHNAVKDSAAAQARHSAPHGMGMTDQSQLRRKKKGKKHRGGKSRKHTSKSHRKGKHHHHHHRNKHRLSVVGEEEDGDGGEERAHRHHHRHKHHKHRDEDVEDALADLLRHKSRR